MGGKFSRGKVGIVGMFGRTIGVVNADVTPVGFLIAPPIIGFCGDGTVID